MVIVSQNAKILFFCIYAPLILVIWWQQFWWIFQHYKLFNLLQFFVYLYEPLKREGDIYFTQCHVIVCIALKNKTIGFIEQNSNKRERDDSMKLKWTLSFNSLRRFRACVYRKKLKQHKISADFHSLLHQIKVFW